MKRFTALALALAACVGFTNANAAEQSGTLKKIHDSGSITIGHRDASIPFSYYDDKQQPIGFAMDLCLRVVDAIKQELKMPKLDVKYQLVTSANRIPLMANGTIDLECGSTTNNAARQKEVAFTITHFLTANRIVSKKSANLKSEADLKGKTMVSTSGTTNIKQLTDLNTSKNMGMNIIPANGHPEAFQMVETGRAVGFVMDDILLYSLVASSRNPSEFVISDFALSLPEPYGIMLRRDDPAFKKVVDNAMSRIYKSGEAAKLYEKWFLKPIPPKNINLNVPLSSQMKNLFANPTDSPDPHAYK
ncbi:MAG TPA: amino acid ABC transporter substrate-binding protein [Burkholderiales bacterium]|nr:amino acid ABC transporter substrate-binding protein [Burkholderiales bacterium]